MLLYARVCGHTNVKIVEFNYRNPLISLNYWNIRSNKQLRTLQICCVDPQI
ncbi:hypothetical protein AG1IA_05810 [Rhizoctonia solani AG-1 IA]|uniref:Uncharacterized protein n=1 Tax=Thanatephorus cucumeris (strain AG1-IA) TaxID=983506 RepID=L8WQ69_THACA|nr:hypothetical protein AG1IA_05810 [Rhizoctonia solani AG-1 IA]